jgi:hypothetical protein
MKAFDSTDDQISKFLRYPLFRSCIDPAYGTQPIANDRNGSYRYERAEKTRRSAEILGCSLRIAESGCKQFQSLKFNCGPFACRASQYAVIMPLVGWGAELIVCLPGFTVCGSASCSLDGARGAPKICLRPR